MENVITLSLLKKYTAKLSKDIPLEVSPGETASFRKDNIRSFR